MAKIISEKIRAEIVNEYKKGNIQANIARKFKVSKGFVSKTIKNINSK